MISHGSEQQAQQRMREVSRMIYDYVVAAKSAIVRN